VGKGDKPDASAAVQGGGSKNNNNNKKKAGGNNQPLAGAPTVVAAAAVAPGAKVHKATNAHVKNPAVAMVACVAGAQLHVPQRGRVLGNQEAHAAVPREAAAAVPRWHPSR
jgi:hypothetical protein